MPDLTTAPTRVEAAGNKPTLIDGYVGRPASGHQAVSVAHMRPPGGWVEPGRTPGLAGLTAVPSGRLRVSSAPGDLDVRAGQAVVVPAREWICSSMPGPGGAEYVAVCLPAFAPEPAHRDDG